MFKRYLLIIIALLIILLVGFYYCFFIKPFSQPEKQDEQAVLIIDFGERKRSFSGEVIDGMTIIDVLSVSAEAGEFNFELIDNYLIKINQIEQNDKKWTVYLNGRKIDQPLNQVLVELEDLIEIKLE
jgi:hypothetical protein